MTDPGTVERVLLALKAADRAGLDRAITLDAAGLLLTDKRRVQIQLATLRQVHDLLDNPAHRLMHQDGGNTAEDLRRCVSERIEEWINMLESK